MKDKILNYLKENSFIVVPVLLIVLTVVIPLPTLLVEILIALNIIFTLMLFAIVLTTENIKTFSLYPTLVLLLTVFGMAINISATRLILSKGAEFDGLLIKFFSSLIAGSEKKFLVMGFIMFIIIIAIDVIIVTKSCTRVSEVAARFTLDSFQVKLMAIETEYSSGAITEDEAQVRKAEVQKESDFYCALDGVSKFVSGNEKIRIIIILASIIGSDYIAIFLKEESISDTIKTYIPLIIGNGILCMMPAFLVSLGMGIIVTREANFKTRKMSFKRTPDNEIRLELGNGFLTIVSEKLENNLQTGIQKLREEIKNEYGIYFPSVRIVDDPGLNDYEYSLIFYGKNIGTYKLETEDIKTNSFNSESVPIILANFKTIIINNLGEIFNYEYSNQISNIKEKHPELVKSVLKIFSLSKIKIILGNILSERKSLANIEKILELILLYSVDVKDVKIMSDMIIRNI